MSSVSVIIPNFNRGSIIDETINNMLSQTLFPHEIIVVDDGSTDNSVDVIKTFGEKVRLIQQPNKGPGAARNAGLKIASGEFIQFMDSDDFASRNKLKVQVESLIHHNADIVYGPWIKVWIKDKKIIPQDVVLQQSPLPSSKSPIYWFLTDWSMVFQQCLVRRSIVEKVGGYREDMYSAEDSDLFVRLLLADARIIHEEQSLTFYRLNDFGKLTASGQNKGKRAFDLALFYQGVLNMSSEHNILKDIILHPHFQLRVWEIIRELKSSLPNKLEPFKDLLQLVGSNDNLKTMQSWLKQKKGGLKQRLKGHRWPDCYKTGSLNRDQNILINDLCYS